jgi:hypothetical protein
MRAEYSLFQGQIREEGMRCYRLMLRDDEDRLSASKQIECGGDQQVVAIAGQHLAKYASVEVWLKERRVCRLIRHVLSERRHGALAAHCTA